MLIPAQLRGEILTPLCTNCFRKYTPDNVKEYMDSGCSECMSGSKKRMDKVEKLIQPRNIAGFNDSLQVANLQGKNADNKSMLYVPGMPADRDLLSANAYAKDGAVVLLNDIGYVIKMTPQAIKEFKVCMQQHDISHILKVDRSTYLVDYRIITNNNEESSLESEISCMYTKLLEIDNVTI